MRYINLVIQAVYAVSLEINLLDETYNKNDLIQSENIVVLIGVARNI